MMFVSELLRLPLSTLNPRIRRRIRGCQPVIRFKREEPNVDHLLIDVTTGQLLAASDVTASGQLSGSRPAHCVETVMGIPDGEGWGERDAIQCCCRVVSRVDSVRETPVGPVQSTRHRPSARPSLSSATARRLDRRSRSASARPGPRLEGILMGTRYQRIHAVLTDTQTLYPPS